jgi:hypothetical protein
MRGNEGIALLITAGRREDIAKAEAALVQINQAFELMRDGGYASNAAYFEQQLVGARRTVDELRAKAKDNAARPPAIRP